MLAVRRVADRHVHAVGAARARHARGRAAALLFTAMKLRTSVFPASWDAQQKAGDVANVVEEDVTGVRVVKGFGQEAASSIAWPSAREAMFASRVRLVNIQARLQPAMQTIPAFGQVAVLALGGWLALHGHITLRHVLRVRLVHAADHAAGAAARGDPHRRPARARRRRTHLRPARLDAARAGPARRDRAARRSAARSLRPRHVRLHVDRTGAPRLHARPSRRARRSRSSADRVRASRRSGCCCPASTTCTRARSRSTASTCAT